jgi:hypothetical protein
MAHHGLRPIVNKYLISWCCIDLNLGLILHIPQRYLSKGGTMQARLLKPSHACTFHLHNSTRRPLARQPSLHFLRDFQSAISNFSTKVMAPPTVGRRHKPAGRSKTNIKSLKRKRDVDDHEKLEKSVAELVCTMQVRSIQLLIYFRTLNQK